MSAVIAMIAFFMIVSTFKFAVANIRKNLPHRADMGDTFGIYYD